ncbi:MAG: ABC transporter substrate-binding protein [Actinomycetota bacterium]
MVRPASLRPDEVVSSDQGAVILADLLYDGLTEVDGASGRLRPGLAIDWTSDDDFRRWTFRLDPAAGVASGAVVASLQAVSAADDGADPVPVTAASLAVGIRSVEATDAATVVVDLLRPNAGLPWILSGLPYSIVGTGGASTGAYEIDGEDAAGLRLRIRPAFDSGGAGPETVSVRWADDASAAYRLLVDGAVDGAVVGPESLADAAQRFGWVPTSTSTVRFYVLNAGSPAFGGLDDRLAVVDAVDTEALVEAADRPDLVAVDGLVSPGAAGWESTASPTGRVAGPAGPADAADESRAPTPATLRLASVGEGGAVLTEALASQLTEAGHEVLEAAVPAPELAASIVDGSTDLFAFGWVAPASAIDAILPPLLGADSPANVARIADPEVGSLLERAARTADDEDRWELLRLAERSALEEGTLLPVAASGSTLVVSSAESGPVIRADGSLDLESSA